MQSLCPGKRFYYKRVALPVTTYVDEKKIVVGYNCLFVLTWILSLVYFIFYTKGWSDTVHARITSTMWMDESVYPKTTLKYCDNRDYDYFEYGQWNYSNIKCRTYSEQTVFTKGISPGNFWVSTLFVEQLYTVDGDTPVKDSKKLYYAEHVEDMKLGLQIAAEVPALNYVSQVPTTSTPMYVQLPRSLTKKQVKEAYQALGLKYNPAVNDSLIDISSISKPNQLIMQFTVSQWLKLCGTSLDEYNNTVFSHPGISTGNAYFRTTGLGVYIDVEFINVPARESTFALSTDYISMILHIKVALNWNRIVLPPRSTQDPSVVKKVDVFGLRFVVRNKRNTKNLLIFSSTAMVTSIFDVVIFFSLMRLLVVAFLFNFNGKKSKTWRKAAKKHIKYFVAELEHEKNEEKRRVTMMLQKHNSKEKRPSVITNPLYNKDSVDPRSNV